MRDAHSFVVAGKDLGISVHNQAKRTEANSRTAGELTYTEGRGQKNFN